MIVLQTGPERRISESSNPELVAVLEEVLPDLAWNRRALATCQAKHNELSAVGGESVRALSDLVQHTSDELLSTGQIDADLVDKAWIAAHNPQAAGAAANVVAQVAARVQSDTGAMISGGADRILSALNDRLQEVVTAARALDVVDGNAEDAIAHRRADVWQSFVTLRARNHDIRDAQALVLSVMSLMSDPKEYAYFRNYTQLDPDFWHATRAYLGGAYREGTPVPWPSDPDGKFLWSIQHTEAELWVPSSAQIAETIAAGHQVAEEARAPTAEERRRIQKRYADAQGFAGMRVI